MNRRELLKMIAALTGGVVAGGEAFLTGCTNTEKTGAVFTQKDIDFLNEVAETILPATQTPGAKVANVGQFMTVIVNDCYDEKDQETFHEGMKKLNDTCDKMHGHSFMKATAQQRHALLVSLDKEAKDYQKKRDDFNKNEDKKEQDAKAGGDKNFKKQTMDPHYFTLMKQLTLWGYFTSKEGMTEALHFLPVPGRYEGCIDYKKGDKVQVGLG